MSTASVTYDALLIGQGLAGTLLAHFLQRAGCSVFVIDPGGAGAASQVAAGIINPITGRRYRKSWRFDELLPAAHATYRALEEALGCSLYRPQPLLRAIFTVREENDWLARSADPACAPYVEDSADLGPYAGCLAPARGYGGVRQAAQVDLGTLCAAYRAQLQHAGRLQAAAFRHEQLELTDEGVRYGALRARQAVFCEGYRGAANPYFDYLPFHGDKGDVLLVRFPGHAFDRIVKHRVFIVPLPDGRYWIGATYQRRFETAAPTPAGRAQLLERLQDAVRIPFEVEDHRAAVRPTVSDRRPLLGRHPRYPQLALFNGLGTKGASLGPFFARQLAAHLTGGAPLDAEVDIRRFEERYHRAEK